MVSTSQSARLCLRQLSHAMKQGVFSSTSKVDAVLKRIFIASSMLLIQECKSKLSDCGHIEQPHLPDPLVTLMEFTASGLHMLFLRDTKNQGDTSYLVETNRFLSALSLHWCIAAIYSTLGGIDMSSSHGRKMPSASILMNDLAQLVSISEIAAASLSLDDRSLVPDFVLKSPLLFTASLSLLYFSKDVSVCEGDANMLEFLACAVGLFVSSMPQSMYDMDDDGSTSLALIAAIHTSSLTIGSLMLTRLLGPITAMCPQAHFIADSNGDFPIHVAAASGNSAAMLWILERLPFVIWKVNGMGCTALHLALSSAVPHAEDAILQLLRSFPLAAFIADSHNFFPLHYAVKHASIQVIKEVFEANPVAILAITSNTGSSCLHLAAARIFEIDIASLQPCKCVAISVDISGAEGGADDAAAAKGHDASGMNWPSENDTLEAIKFVTSKAPSLAAVCDMLGQTPLHVAAANSFADIDSLAMLLQLYPQAATIFDAEDNLPLHAAAARLSNLPEQIVDKTTQLTGNIESCILKASKSLEWCVLKNQERAIRFLLKASSPGAAAEENSDGMTPLDLFRFHKIFPDEDDVGSEEDFESDSESEMLAVKSCRLVVAPSSSPVLDCGTKNLISQHGHACGCPYLPGEPPIEIQTQALVDSIERVLLRADASQDSERLRELNWGERRLAMLALHRTQQEYSPAELRSSAAGSAPAVASPSDFASSTLPLPLARSPAFNRVDLRYVDTAGVSDCPTLSLPSVLCDDVAEFSLKAAAADPSPVPSAQALSAAPAAAAAPAESRVSVSYVELNRDVNVGRKRRYQECTDAMEAHSSGDTRGDEGGDDKNDKRALICRRGELTLEPHAHVFSCLCDSSLLRQVVEFL